MFHQDFDLEGCSVREAIAVQVAHMDRQERLLLKAALAAYPTPQAFEEHFVRLGAENWTDGEPREELERILPTL